MNAASPGAAAEAKAARGGSKTGSTGRVDTRAGGTAAKGDGAGAGAGAVKSMMDLKRPFKFENPDMVQDQMQGER